MLYRKRFLCFLEVKSGGNNTRTISEKALAFISQKLSDPQSTITSYVELALLIEEELKESIAYKALYSHCIHHHKSKLRFPENHITRMTHKLKSFLKNLKTKFNKIRLSLNKNKIESVNLYFQDERRFGLITKQKRVLTARGIKPVAEHKHSYLYKWLWGSFSPIAGESFCMTTNVVYKKIFLKYLEDFSKDKPKELKILVIDNAFFYSTKDWISPQNIVLLPIPPYCPELNPAERVWQWMKDKIAMKIFDTLESLENKMDKIIQEIENQRIMSITAYQFYIKTFFSVF